MADKFIKFTKVNETEDVQKIDGNRTLPLMTPFREEVKCDKLSQSLNMKALRSSIHLLNMNQSSKLSHLCSDFERSESVSLSDMKEVAEVHIPVDTLTEMEVRVKSRLSAYDESERPESGQLSQSLHSFSYAPPNRNSLGVSPSPQTNQSLNASWQFYNFVGVDENEVVYNGANRKPSEAILTIDAKTSHILVANHTAYRLFGYKEEELCSGMKIYDLFTMEDGFKQKILVEGTVDTDGNVVMASGKILEAVDIDGNVFVVSVWMKQIKLGKAPRCVVIMEPVEVNKGSFLFNAEGTIEDCDFLFAFLHGYEDPQDVVGCHIHQFIPALLLPTPRMEIQKEVRKQRATSRTKDTIPFPTTIKIKVHDPDFHHMYIERTPSSKQQASKFLYKGFMWVFANISGLVVVSGDGMIKSCNANFLTAFLGFNESELLGKNITMLVPHFYEQIDLLCDDSLRVTSQLNTYVDKASHHECTPQDLPSGVKDIEDINQEEEVKQGSDHPDNNTENPETENKAASIHVNENSHSEVPTQDIQDVSKKPNVSSSINSDSVFQSPIKPTSLHDIPKAQLASMDGFSPHLETSTPKHEDTGKHVVSSGVSPSRQHLDFDTCKSDTEKEIAELDSGLESIFASNEKPSGDQNPNKLVELHENIENKGLVIESKEHHVKDFIYPSKEHVLTSKKYSDYESLGSTIDDVHRIESAMHHKKEFHAHPLKDYHKPPKTSDYESASSIIEDSDNYNSSLNLQNCHNLKHERKVAWHEKNKQIVQGNYYGQARHKDSSMLPILFEIKKIPSKHNQLMYCIWISRDPEEEGECTNKRNSQFLAASYNSTLNASAGNFQELLKSMKDLTVDDPGRGPFNDKFSSIKCIGKGAFGFVNLAERKSNKEQIVVKFIRKEKVLKDSWVNDDELGKVPFEIYLLAQIEHPNIVKMLEAYENEEYFQMVMEKHGDGIDLFEFIDRKPLIDEALASYMFRQVLFAAEYLHSQKILHRDIKDENIIVDRQFNLKLIDFGSATYLEDGKLFNTFCGTVEYCSPEVLLGNWYEGPELEMWSLGVTLYTFIFGEHPFFEIEETIRAELFPPFKVSNELMFVICWMLHAEVEFRAKLKDVLNYPWFSRPVDISNYDYSIVLGEEVCPTEERESCKAPSQLPPNTQDKYNISCSSSSSSSMSSSSELSDLTSVDSELDRNDELLKEEYQKYLKDQHDVKLNTALSKSF